ncbi:double-stranded RNA-specific editase Adar isoform X2 [Agrilus planipennis]|uniref:Double-stranded RNA-specific editase Adar isoform X2 n=1 Tax=Agrilus planipennis TaxID=224129 RepID=A0A7F5R5R1_AGRPL|nr:double-stranded RNA-specific editase Adar isoform X2 [Agrilus planipennis]
MPIVQDSTGDKHIDNFCATVESLNLNTTEMITECLKNNLKNPVTILDELKVCVDYVELGQTQSKYGPIYTTLITVNGVEFIGEGWSKVIAKTKAAEKALTALVGFVESYEFNRPNGISGGRNEIIKGMQNMFSEIARNLQPHTKEMIRECLKNNFKNPLNILDQLKVSIEYGELEQIGSKYGPLYRTWVTINGVEFIGEGWSKIIAKTKAVEKALTALIQFSGNDEFNRSNVISGGRNEIIKEMQSVQHSIDDDIIDMFSETARNLQPHIKEMIRECLKENLKNPVSILNELEVLVDYVELEQSESEYGPIFRTSVFVNGVEFIGQSWLQVIAKTKAAEKALTALVQIVESYEFNSPNGISRGENEIIKEMQSEQHSIGVVNFDNFSATARNLQPHAKEMIRECLKNNFKNPVNILDELKVSVDYGELEETRSEYGSIYRTSVVVNGVEFIGEGWSKIIAKTKAVQKALTALVESSESYECNRPDGISDARNGTFKGNSSGTTAYPVMILNYLYSEEAKYELEENSKRTFDRFKCIVRLKGQEFHGTGSSKKNAKYAAALEALTALQTLHPSLIQALRKCSAPPDKLIFADRVRRMIYDKLSDLARDNPNILKRKVLAGIVMTKDECLHDLTVICVATGTKCINGGNICPFGNALNDMHAEIVTRRCLLDYFYDQLELTLIKGEQHNSIFVCDGNGCRLKEGIKFHLYISTTPCGAANLPFSRKDSGNNSSMRIRAKMEAVHGTVPVDGNTTIQTWDGVLLGAKLLNMSCSDKIARWNVLGLQGSLLSRLMDPVYLSSVILGRPNVDECQVQRALFGRIEQTLGDLPNPYRHNKSELYLTSSRDSRCTDNAPDFCVNWTIGRVRHEIIDTATGRTKEGPSRLSKYNLFQRFLRLEEFTSSQNMRNGTTYLDSKSKARKYNKAKNELFSAFADAKLGHWVKKPLEQDQF